MREKQIFVRSMSLTGENMTGTRNTLKTLARKVEMADAKIIRTSERRYRRRFEALQKNEYIRYEDLPLKTNNGRLIDVELVTLGVAVSPEHGATSTEILRAVDAALYRAKHEGRSRVVIAR